MYISVFFRFKRFWFCSFNVPVNIKRQDLHRLAICKAKLKMNSASWWNAMMWIACLNPVHLCTMIWNGSLALLCRRIFNLRSFDLRPEPWPWVAPLSVLILLSVSQDRSLTLVILVRRKGETLVIGTERRALFRSPVQYLNNEQNLRPTPGQAEPTAQHFFKNFEHCWKRGYSDSKRNTVDASVPSLYIHLVF